MKFLKIARNHWHPADFDLSQMNRVEVQEDILYISKVVALLESRSDQYAGYLHSVFHMKDSEWHEANKRWNFEEKQHGVVLRNLCEATDADFCFDDNISVYLSQVAYHSDHDGVSVRGSVAAELVARCVVEALASTLYRVLGDSVNNATYKAVFQALSRDEARHFGMFKSMLDAEHAAGKALSCFQRSLVALRRMLELEDDQIMFASCVAKGRPKEIYDRRFEANFYISRLYKYYRWRHLIFAGKLISLILTNRPSKAMQFSVGLILYVALKARWCWAVVSIAVHMSDGLSGKKQLR
jgi:hypothetical protein